MRMRHREKILYGIEHKQGEELPVYRKGYEDGRGQELYALEEGASSAYGNTFSSFKLRMILSVAPFLRRMPEKEKSPVFLRNR